MSRPNQIQLVFIFGYSISGPENESVDFNCVLTALDKQPNGLLVWLPVPHVKYHKSRYGYAYPKDQTKALIVYMTKRFSSSTWKAKPRNFEVNE